MYILFGMSYTFANIGYMSMQSTLSRNNFVQHTLYEVILDYSFQSGYRAIMDNIETVKKHSAIFALSDLMALGAIQALQTLNIKVPEDIAVIGYDDIELGTYFFV